MLQQPADGLLRAAANSKANLERNLPCVSSTTPAIPPALAQVILSNASVQAGSIDRNALLDAVESVTGKKAWLVCNTT